MTQAAPSRPGDDLIEPAVRDDGGARRVVAAIVAVLLAGGVYLYVVRGAAMLLDLPSGMAGAFCF